MHVEPPAPSNEEPAQHIAVGQVSEIAHSQVQVSGRDSLAAGGHIIQAAPGATVHIGTTQPVPPLHPSNTVLASTSVPLVFTLAIIAFCAGLIVILLGTPSDTLALALGTLWFILFAIAIGAWLTTMQSAGAGYERRYTEHVYYRHRTFDVKGLTTQSSHTLELNQVFVELALSPRPAHQISSDSLRGAHDTDENGEALEAHSLWHYIKRGATNAQSLVILGPPGSGKTTLLKHVALTLIARRAPAGIPARLPIVLFLRDHAEAIRSQPDFTLLHAIHANLARFQGPPAPPNWFEHRLTTGQCLILLDGLDEIADAAARQAVVTWVEQQMEAFGRCSFIITSRPFGYRTNPLAGVTVLETRPFTIEQITHFIHNWYLANEIMSTQKNDPGVQMSARQGAEDLLARMRSAYTLAALAVNPLLLTMIANVHRYRSSLPGRRVDLYAEICDVFLGKRQAARGITLELTPAQQRSVLQPLAFFMMEYNEREITQDDAVNLIATPLARVNPRLDGALFLKGVENASSLLVEREPGVYSFAHLTFQEYLASVYILENKLEARLVAEIENAWWHETIRLYCAQTDATAIITACLADEQPSAAALMLAVECLEEAREVQPAQRARLEMLLEHGAETSHIVQRSRVAEAMLALRMRRLIPLDDARAVDPPDNAYITHLEYQLFLDDQRARGVYRQPDHWSSARFPRGAGQTPIAGVRASDAALFCAWLTERLHSPYDFHLPTTDDLADIATLPPAETRLGFWSVNEQAFRCVFPGPSAVPTWPVLTLDHATALPLIAASDPMLAREIDETFDEGLLTQLALTPGGIVIALPDLAVHLRQREDIQRLLKNVKQLNGLIGTMIKLVTGLEGQANNSAVYLKLAQDNARTLAALLSATPARERDLPRVFQHALAHHTHADATLNLERYHKSRFTAMIASFSDRQHAQNLVRDLSGTLDRTQRLAQRGPSLTADRTLNAQLVDQSKLASAIATSIQADLDFKRVHQLTGLLVCLFDLVENRRPQNDGALRAAQCAYGAYYACALAAELLAWYTVFNTSGRRDEHDLVGVALCLETYRDLTLLAQRIQGRAPALEGIRVVRALRKTNAPVVE